MATINNITVKNVKSFSGIEYPTCYECSIYNGNKRIGTYCQDQWGGEGHFSPNSLYNDLKPFAEKYKEGCKKDKYYEFQGEPENFISSIIQLHQYEKDFRRNVKNGWSTTVYFMNSFKTISCGFRSAIDEKNIPKSLTEQLKKHFPKNDYKIWQANSEKDFDITIDGSHPIPCFL